MFYYNEQNIVPLFYYYTMSDKEKIKDLEVRLAYYEESPFAEGYNAVRKQLDNWSNEISEDPVNLRVNSDDDNKAFEKAHKFISTIDVLYDKLEYLRLRLTPEQLKEQPKSKKQIKSNTIPLG